MILATHAMCRTTHNAIAMCNCLAEGCRVIGLEFWNEHSFHFDRRAPLFTFFKRLERRVLFTRRFLGNSDHDAYFASCHAVSGYRFLCTVISIPSR